MKRIYDAPKADLMNLASADVITLSNLGTLGADNWDGIDVNDLTWSPIE